MSMSLSLSPSAPLLIESAAHLMAMFAGVVWVSLAIYISLISEVRNLTLEVWVSFAIGALLLYLGVGGDFPHSEPWLIVRIALYVGLTIAAFLLYRIIQRSTHMLPASVRLVSVFRRIF